MEQPADSQPLIDDSPLTSLGQRLLREHGQQPVEIAAEEQIATSLPSQLLLWLAVPFFFLDLLLGPVSILEIELRGPLETCFAVLVIGGWIGLIATQGTLWSLYFALSPESRWQRLRILMPQIILCGAAGLLGFAFLDWYQSWNVNDRERWENALRFYCLLPIIVIAGQAPFFACRFLGWSIQRVNSNSAPLPAEVRMKPASIAELLMATAAVAAAFGLVRAAPTSTLGEPELIWQFVAVFASLAGGISLFGGVPLIVLLHYARSPLFRLAWIVGVLFLAFIVSSVLYGYLTSWQQLQREGPFNTFVFGTIILTFLATFSWFLRLLRWQGWTIGPRVSTT